MSTINDKNEEQLCYTTENTENELQTNYYGYVYKFTCIATGKIYVGKHKFSRCCLDENYYGSGTVWSAILEKYGTENIKREILQWCETLEELNSAEIYWVAELNARDKSIGYNLAPGGDGGCLGPEAMQKMVETRMQNGSYISWNTGLTKETDERVARYSEALTGKQFSEEHKQKLSDAAKARLADKSNHPLFGRHWVEGDLGVQAMKGKHFSQEIRDKFSRAQKASQHNKGKNNPMYGVHRYGGSNPRAIRIICVETETIFECIKDANEWLKQTIGHGGHIGECLKGRKETICGYHWKYLE